MSQSGGAVSVIWDVSLVAGTGNGATVATDNYSDESFSWSKLEILDGKN